MTRNALKIENELSRIAECLGLVWHNASAVDFYALRRASMTLQRWFGRECGDSNEYASFCVERDEKTNAPYQVRISHRDGRTTRYRIPDREAGARKRIAEICARLNLHYYIQTDLRGTALYIAREELDTRTYTRGYAIGK